MKHLFAITILGLALPLGMPAWAGMEHADRSRPAGHAGAEEALADGVVKKVDRAQGKLTIRHGPLKNLDMPPMTMVFRVQDVAMLDRVKPGDAIRFQAERVNGAFTVIRLEAVR